MMHTPGPAPEDLPDDIAGYFGRGYYALYRRRLIPGEQTEAEVRFLLQTLDPAEGERWLDVPCAYGRHLSVLRRLAPRLRLVGGDLNRAYLRERGLRRCAAPVCCDMRRLPFAGGAFDTIINLLNSFGYFPLRLRSRSAPAVPDDRSVLAEWARLLRPGGRLAMDLPNRRALLQLVRTRPRVRYAVEHCDVEEVFGWDPATQCLLNRTCWRWRDGIERSGYRLRLYTPAEIRGLLARGGFAIQAVHGDFRGGPFQGDSDRMLLICRRD
jgi:SAM-dependent methyltransferase